MNKNDVSRQALLQAEINALAMQTMAKVKRGDTLPTNGIYRRMLDMLEERYRVLTPHPTLPLESVNDWLAIGLFSQDRAEFQALCAEASQAQDPIYLRAEPWLRKLLEHDRQADTD